MPGGRGRGHGRGRRRAVSSSAAPSAAARSSGRSSEGADHLAADRPRAEDADAQAGAAHDLGRAGRDIRRMVADPSERPPAASSATPSATLAER